MGKYALQGIIQSNTFRFSEGFSDKVMRRLEEEKIQKYYSHAFKQVSWMSAAAMILLFIGAYTVGDNYMAELSYEAIDEYLLYND